MISATPSGGWLQSSPVIPELGFPLGSRLQMCWLEEGLPASLMPGRRPRTTLSPTLVYREEVPLMACGTPGGDGQDQWQLVFLLGYLTRGLNLQQAIDAPTWQSNAMPSSFYPRGVQPGELVVEDRFGPDVLDSLRRRGHRVVVAPGGRWGGCRRSAMTRRPGWCAPARTPAAARHTRSDVDRRPGNSDRRAASRNRHSAHMTPR